jgi:hypothetical protein
VLIGTRLEESYYQEIWEVAQATAKGTSNLLHKRECAVKRQAILKADRLKHFDTCLA